jgi:thiosulfate dehydrogenase
MRFLKSYWLIILAVLAIIAIIIMAIVFIPGDLGTPKLAPVENKKFEWDAPDILRAPNTAEGDLIRYGRKLVAHTSFFLGPKGTIASITNGMNCQNCHLAAGTKYLGNNYSAVYSTYPKFRARSGAIETIYKRINDCMERSLNGKGLDTNSREMQSIYAYIKWLGQNVPKNLKPPGAGIADLPFMDRAADTARGKIVYIQNCQRCHATNGEGVLNADGTEYQYPPLWGMHSYNAGAGLYRISRLAGYIRHNMPFDKDEKKEVLPLTDEEAWDVAAFIISQPRPVKKFPKDWPDISAKPIDHPFGPYKDSFKEQQHKYGPFDPIVNYKKQNSK